MFRRFLSLIEVQYLLVVLQRLRLRSIFVSVPRARPECGQIAMLIRDGRRRNGSAARGRRTDGRTDADGVARSPPSSIGAVAAFGSQIYGGDSEQRRQLGDRKRRKICRTDAPKLLQIANDTLQCGEAEAVFFTFLCMCPYAIKRVDVHVQWWAEALFPGLVNFVPAVAYHFYPNLPAVFTQPGALT